MNPALLLIASAFSLWRVDPYGDVPYLPDSPPAGGIVTNSLSFAAARGEFESLSFSVQPERDMEKVDFIPSDLVGPGGAVIPASASDFALVKVWYRADGRWRTSWAGNTGKPTLINNLIIHDDDLIRVVESDDIEKRTYFLRIDYPEGPAYIDMRKHGGAGSPFNYSLHPVKDAEKFIPFDLKKGRFQQYWLTWKIPDNAEPGTYKGHLEVRENGKFLAKIPLTAEVYPFTLPLARTHYDTNEPFISAWMGLPSLEGELAASKQLDLAEKKVRAVYRSCAEHNVHCPSGPGTFQSDSTDDLAVRSLIMMRQEGMNCRLLINGQAYDAAWASPHGDDFETPEQNPERYEEAKARYTKMAEIQKKVLLKYLGHQNCYFYSLDECGTWFNRRSYGFWGILNSLGFESWTDYGEYIDIAWSVGMNDVPASARHSVAWNWHAGGAKAVTYAGPFTGPADPDIWRRTKGLRYYYADFDGHHEYCFAPGENQWNDFSFRGEYSQFQMVYFTIDGLITTLAWEGVREGLDDIRYLSLLRMRAEAAMKSKDPAVQAEGRRQIVWMDSQDPEAIIDLDAFRREVARRTVEMIKLVGDQPADEAPLPPPALPPLSYERGGGGYSDAMKNAKEMQSKNRYDLAVPLFGKIRSDESETPQRRFDAAVTEAGLLCAILRRDEAVEVIEKTMKIPALKGAHRAKLQMLKAKILMTPRIYEEEFTREQLDVAAAVISSALKLAGTSISERYGAILKITDGYLAGGHAREAVKFAAQMIEEVPLRPYEKSPLYIRQAKGYIQMEDWDNAAKLFRIARQTHYVKDRTNLRIEGEVAEKREDWKTAAMCYADEATTYGDEEKAKKAACVRRLNRVQEKLRKNSGAFDIIDIDQIDTGTFIELDE